MFVVVLSVCRRYITTVTSLRLSAIVANFTRTNLVYRRLGDAIVLASKLVKLIIIDVVDVVEEIQIRFVSVERQQRCRYGEFTNWFVKDESLSLDWLLCAPQYRFCVVVEHIVGGAVATARTRIDAI